MTTVEVTASRSYRVEIGHSLLSSLGRHVEALGSVQKALIVSDSNVWPLYGEQVQASLTRSGIETVSFLIAAGEESKNVENYLAILGELAENHLTRSDVIVALGGGVVGDLAGFAAATWLRGIRFVQVPTTLLAAVDASVGGKTGIDLSAGKNLVGAFWQPSLVLCDVDTLNTLPMETFRDGCAEVIKTAVLFDPELFAILCRDGLAFDREQVIARCVSHKRDIVAADEFEQGERRKLNLGHTVGHCVELLSNFAVSHGNAVSIGMAVTARAAVKMGLAPRETATKIQWLLMSFDLPRTVRCTAADLALAARSDKKCTGGDITLVIPEQIGSSRLYSMSLDDLQEFMEAGL